jgi:hypothetical protein
MARWSDKYFDHTATRLSKSVTVKLYPSLKVGSAEEKYPDWCSNR